MLAGALFLSANPASAELYKYRNKDGSVLITSEKRSDLKLIEVISASGASSKPTSKSAKSNLDKARELKQRSQSRTREKTDVAKEKKYDDIIAEASEAYDVPFGFIKAVIRVESNFNPNALSHAGAMGLMQLMPRTAASLNVTDPYDPRQNIFGGTKFLRILIDRYDGDINLILAAYNAGDAAVARYDGIPYPKTRGYVSKVYSHYRNYSKAASGE